MANPLEVELSKLDESAPLCIGTLARLLNAQSKVLLGEFNKQIDELNETRKGFLRKKHSCRSEI